MSYPDPVYSHRNATGTGPGQIVDIGTADETDYPPVMIVNVTPIVAPIITTTVIDGVVTYLANSEGSTWTECRNQLTAQVSFDVEGRCSSEKTGEDALPPYSYSIGRSLMQFDTSALTGTVIGVAMELFIEFPLQMRDVTCHIVDRGTVVDNWPFALTDYPLIGSTDYGSLHVVTGQYPNEWATFDLNGSANSYINLSGNTIFGAREEHDLFDNEPAPEPQLQALHLLVWGQNDLSTCCRLVVTTST